MTEIISITPMLIRDTVEVLEKRRVHVPISLILTYLQENYPVEKNKEILMNKIVQEANNAVKKGLLMRCSENSLCLPTLRWEATCYEFGFD